MSEVTGSYIDQVVVYVPLLNEGTDVVRPVTSVRLGPDVYQLHVPDEYDPDLEEWEYPPGSTVQCVEESREGKTILVARRRLDNVP